MFKKVLVVGILCLSTVGCAALQPLADKYVPKITAQLSDHGIAVHVDPKFGFESFCLDPIGEVANLLGKVPVLGDFLTGFVGMCDTTPVE